MEIPSHPGKAGPPSWRAASLLGTVAIGLLLRLALSAWALQAPGRHLFPDSTEYLALADGLLSGRGFTQDTRGTPEIIRTPGIPVVLAALGAVSRSAQVPLTLLLQALVILIPAVALGRELPRWGAQTRSAVFLVAVLALDPISLGLSAGVVSEPLFLVLAGLRLALILRSLAGAGGRTAFLCGFVSGLMALVRPIASFLWIADLLALSLGPHDQRRRRLLLACLGFAAATGPWAGRNASLGVNGLSSGGGSQLLNWNAALVESSARQIPFWDVRQEYEVRFAGSSMHTRDALGVFLDYPVDTARVAIVSVVALLADPGHQQLLKPLGLPGTGLRSGVASEGALASAAVLLACILWLGSLAALCLRGARRLWAEDRTVLAACAITSGYFVLLSVHVTLLEGARFRAPLVPVAAFLAAIGSRRPSLDREAGPNR